METRRNFIKTATAASVGLGATANAEETKDGTKKPKTIPTRDYAGGKEKVTQLCMGGFHVGDKPEALAEKLVEKAMEEGIRFFDTARTYQSGGSETYYGKFLTPKYRDKIHLLTKSEKKTGMPHPQ